MTLFRIIVIGMVIWLVYRLIINWFDKPALKKRPAKEIGHMVRCALCGLHIPKPESIKCADLHYCCQEHREKDQNPN